MTCPQRSSAGEGSGSRTKVPLCPGEMIEKKGLRQINDLRRSESSPIETAFGLGGNSGNEVEGI